MKLLITLYTFSLGCLLTAINACTKNKVYTEESQGTNFNLLLKTVMKLSNFNTDEITNFRYNSSGGLIEITTSSFDQSTGKPYKTIETFFRNATGRIDSINYKIESEGQIIINNNTIFHYNTSNDLSPVYTKNGGDSSSYTFSGGQLVKRKNYTNCCGSGLSLLSTFNYSYDNARNLIQFVSSYTTHPVSDTVLYTFDLKIFPIPALRGINWVFFWAPAFFDDYTFKNNPLSKRQTNSDNFDYEYQYTPNDKPLYQKIKDASGPLYAEVYYYYD